MDASHAVPIPYLIEVVAFLISVVVITPVFKRIGVSPILGYLGVGALIGPHSFAVVKDVESVQHVAELGVIFLLFTIGLELSFARLKAFSKMIFGLGTAQVVVSTAVIGVIAFLWGNTLESSIVIGMCLALSSTAMVMQVLKERGENASPHGRASFAVLLFQDLAVVPILILVSVFGGSASGSVWLDVGLALLRAFVAVLIIVVVGHFILRHLFKIASQSGGTDVFTSMMLLVILATSLLTGMAGLSMALGAFLAGLLLAETEFRLQIESEIEPFKGLLLGLFFMGVGMNIDFYVAFERGIWVLLSVFGLLFIKTVVMTLLARLFLGRWGVSLRSALLLAEAGEFAFVVIGQASLVYGIVSESVGQFMVVVAGISMMLTPLLAWLGEKADRFLSKSLGAGEISAEETKDIAGHVVIAGFGRVGKAVASVLRSQNIPYIGFDKNAEEVNRLRKKGEPVFFGDANRVELLERSGIATASVVLVTMDDEHAAKNTVHLVRRKWPHVRILVRARDAAHTSEYLNAGATSVVPETLEASLQLSGHVLCALGMQREEANAVLEIIRRHDYSEVR